jgi:long-chain acyl-CoA synthetase
LPDAVLLTGATGFVGGALLRALAADGRDVVCLTRRPVEGAGRQLHGELTRDVPALPEDVTTIVHCAASVRFDMPLAEQRAINVEGTRRLLERAAALPHLERFVHVSTAFVAGRYDGVAGPDVVGDDPRNPYEQTKAEAEAVVRASGLPFQIVRPSIVVGDSRTGWTSSFNVLYAPLRAFSRGLITAVPGRAEAVVDVVPVDHLVAALRVLLDAPTGGTHQVVAGPNATTVGELVQLAAAAFGKDAPPFAGGADLGELLPYFDVSTRFADPATAALLAEHGVVAPPLRDYFDRLVAFAQEARWGKRAIAA